jgi:hypothetical protein
MLEPGDRDPAGVIAGVVYQNNGIDMYRKI